MGFLPGLPSPDGLIHVPGPIADPHEPANAGHVGALAQHVNDQALHEHGEALFALGPRHLDLKHAVLWTVYTRNSGIQEGLEPAGVEGSPDSKRGMIPTSQFAAAARTAPPDADSMINLDIRSAFCRVQLDVGNKPRVAHLKIRHQVRVHRGLPPGKTIAGHLLTENPEGP